MIRTLIADDEPPARAVVAEYLADFPELTIVGECGNGPDCIKTIHNKEPDLVFLDIQMPGKTGFEVLEELRFVPSVIFCTAYDHFALQAFEVNAVDYLLKPYTRERFGQAVRRALERRTVREPEMDRMLALLQDTRGRDTTYADRIFVRQGSRIVPVPVDSILWVEAAGDYARLHSAGDSYLCTLGMGEIEKRLDPSQFVRVHRSVIVAIGALRHLESDNQGGFYATLTNGVKVRVSRSFAPAIRTLIV